MSSERQIAQFVSRDLDLREVKQTLHKECPQESVSGVLVSGSKPLQVKISRPDIQQSNDLLF